MKLGDELELECSFEDAISRVMTALGAEGFGVISRTDLDKAFKEKIGVDFHRYSILGACNPALAHKAVVARPEVGLLLPCNITIEETDGRSRVRIVDAATVLGVGNLGKSPEIQSLVEDAGARLDRVAASLKRAVSDTE